MSSPLHLEKYILVEVALIATKSDEVSSDFGVTARPTVIRQEADPGIWAIRLHVEIHPADSDLVPPYTGQVEFLGFFTVAAEFPDDRLQKMVAANGAAILYGAAREVVANLSARGPHPMITLPSLSFVPTASDLGDRENEGRESRQKKSRPKQKKAVVIRNRRSERRDQYRA